MTIAAAATRIDLSLVSHTNVGKTSLMRTLMRRDIGEVADRPHMTEHAEGHTLMQTAEGDELRLWDTPGFGDSARLLKRLRASGNPIGWALTQVWDRFTDRPFFSSQQAMRNVRDESDVVLYLVNAAEDPASAGYVESELQILRWIGKPVLLLLNQMGPARPREAEAADEERWSRHLAAFVPVREVIALDAFARCWVQEDRLLAAVCAMLAEAKQPALQRLRGAWRERNLRVFDASMEILAMHLAEMAADREAIQTQGSGAAGFARKAVRWLVSLAGAADKPDPATERGLNALAQRLDAYVRASTDRLIELHGLSGRAKEGIFARLAGQFEVSTPADVGTTGVIGGMVSGALGGLAADLSAGGLTFGAGALLGGILGALGAGGAARAYNLASGAEGGSARWSADFLSHRPAAALLRYLAVAHYGRGRGDWVEGEYPAHWRVLVDGVVAAHRARFDTAWSLAEKGAGVDVVAAQLLPVVSDAARETLMSLYPQAAEIFGSEK